MSYQTILIVAGALAIVGCSSSPRAPVVHRSPSDVLASAKVEYYTVGRGDTLSAISTRFSVSVRDLISWNSLPANPILQAGQVLRVLEPRSAGGAVIAPTAPPVPVPPVAANTGQSSGQNGAQTGEIRAGSTVETRPIPTSPPPASSSPVVPAPGATAPVPIKTEPKGTKRVYSDANLAELQKANSSVPAPVAVLPPVTPTTAPASPTPSPTAGATPVTPGTKSAWSWPSDGKLARGFEEGKSRGMSLGGRPGDSVVASAEGKVIFAGAYLDYGNMIIIKHSDDVVSIYAQNRKLLVKEEQTIKRGQKIAEQGTRLDFEVRLKSKAVDPMKYLPER
jgi:lipoprotein NlpD